MFNAETSAIIAGRRAQLDRMQANHPEWHADRFLSALGHPGYGKDRSAQVLDIWTINADLDLHEICMG